MKKRQIFLALLALLTALILVLPVFAEGAAADRTDERPPDPEPCTDSTCQASPADTTEHASPCETEHSHTHTLSPATLEHEALKAERAYRKSISRLTETCEHPKTSSYADADTGKTGYLCFVCNSTWEDATVSAEAAGIKTSAAIRGSCAHNYGEWRRYSAKEHSRICSICSNRDRAPHYRMAATCESDEYCRDCNTHEDNWEDAYLHDLMAYEYDWAASEASGIDCHDYLCKREVPSMWVCGHIQIDNSPCAINPQFYIEAAIDGVHEKFQECISCGNLTNFIYVDCTLTVYGDCYECENLNPYG